MEHSHKLVGMLISACCLGHVLSTPAHISLMNDIKQERDTHTTSGVSCPCDKPQWCQPITTSGKEVLAFSVKNDPSHWELFDWTRVTTVAMFGYINESLMCLAHSHGARVVFLGSVNNQTFLKPENRKKWISHQLEVAKSNFLDGINFDYENAIDKNDSISRAAYTSLVRETNEAFKKELPHSQVSVDVGWTPNADGRYYDYLGLAESADFLFVMAYDEQSQIFGECLAGPNSGLDRAYEGLHRYMTLPGRGIPPNKLVLGVPWYGYKYHCIKLELEGDKCHIKEVPFRGVPCSDAAGTQSGYVSLVQILATQVGQAKWNETSSTPFATYTDSQSNLMYQLQFDNPPSLSKKYRLAADLGVRGVGMWTIDYLDYSNTEAGRTMRKEMFGALPQRQMQATSHTEARSQRLSERPACPCRDQKLCEPIKDMNRKEVFAFSNVNDPTHWQGFDWSKLTTVVMFNYLNTSLMCLAHSHGVKAVVLGSIPELIVFSPELRHLWVEQQTQIVYDNYLDGLNFDYEHTLLPSEHFYREAFTDLVKHTVSSLRKVQPYAQVSVCTVVNASSPVMAYDYPAIAEAADFLFIMAYDDSGNRNNGPNAGYHMTQAGVETYLKKNIPPSKLVMGLPWYGDVYQCVNLTGDNCIIEPDGKGFAQQCYSVIDKELQTVPDNYRWNASSLTPYFTYTDPKTKKGHLVQFDNSRSLSYKYQLAVKMDIRGVGIFLIDCLDYSNTAHAKAVRKDFFDVLPTWNKTSTTSKPSSPGSVQPSQQQVIQRKKEMRSLKFVPETKP